MHKGALSGVKDKAPIPEAFYLSICIIICIIRHKQRVIDILSILKSENKYFNIEVQLAIGKKTKNVLD